MCARVDACMQVRESSCIVSPVSCLIFIFWYLYFVVTHTHTRTNTCRSRLAEQVPSAKASALLLKTLANDLLRCVCVRALVRVRVCNIQTNKADIYACQKVCDSQTERQTSQTAPSILKLPTRIGVVCVCVCVCEREREREREVVSIIYVETSDADWSAIFFFLDRGSTDGFAIY